MALCRDQPSIRIYGLNCSLHRFRVSVLSALLNAIQSWLERARRDIETIDLMARRARNALS